MGQMHLRSVFLLKSVDETVAESLDQTRIADFAQMIDPIEMLLVPVVLKRIQSLAALFRQLLRFNFRD